MIARSCVVFSLLGVMSAGCGSLIVGTTAGLVLVLSSGLWLSIAMVLMVAHAAGCSAVYPDAEPWGAER